MRWEQGQHVAIVGSTGTGKTFLESRLLEMRSAVIVLRTKADDVTFTGFSKIKSIDQMRVTQLKYELMPKYDEQRAEIHRALELAWKQGKWCVAVDELFYLCEQLKLTRDVDRLLTQGRSKRISTVCGMQRPSRVTRFALSESALVFVFRAEGRDVKLIAEATTPRIIPALAALRKYEFAYFNRISGVVEIARAQQLEAL